jgi:hypothetical protein
VLALVEACGSGGDDDLGPAATIGPGPTTTSTTARPVDVAVIPEDPAEIDEAYVQAVVDALFAVDAQATKIFVETQQLDEEAIDILRSIYVGDELNQQIDVWSQTLDSETLLSGALDHEVTRLIQVFEDCVFFAAERDYSLTSSEPSPARVVYLGISPKPSGDDLNPTGWVLFTDGFNADGSEPENACDPV